MVDASGDPDGEFSGDAFEYVFRAMTPNWARFENEIGDPGRADRAGKLTPKKREASRRAWITFDDAQFRTQ